MNTTRLPRPIMLLALATASVTIGMSGVAQATPPAPRELPPTTAPEESPPTADAAVDAVAGVPDESDGADAVPTTAAVVVTTTIAPSAPLAPTTTIAPPTSVAPSTTVAPATTQAPTTAPANGPSGQSAMLVVPAAIAPTAPRSLAATPRNASVALTWVAPSSNGGAAIDMYAVQRATSASGPWTNVAFPQTLSYNVTGLANGTTYFFRIRAHNSAGWGAPSTVVSAKPRTVPTAPQSLNATPGNGSIALTWAAPSSNGGATINKYAVQRATNLAGPWTNIAYPATLSYTNTGLTNGTSYYFRIVAINAAGWSAVSSYVINAPRTVPNAPYGMTLNPSSGKVTLGWKAPHHGGALIYQYAVQRSLSGSGPWVNVGFPSSTTYTDANLVNGTRYFYRVLARNSAGWSAPGPVVTAVPTGVPGVPRLCGVFQNYAGSNLVWSTFFVPLSDGGQPLDYYSIRIWDHDGELHEALPPAGDIQIQGAAAVLDFGDDYVATIRAHNMHGYGPACTVTFDMEP
jgi:hypothetical protein